jgi:hypothetical protein
LLFAAPHRLHGVDILLKLFQPFARQTATRCFEMNNEIVINKMIIKKSLQHYGNNVSTDAADDCVVEQQR